MVISRCARASHRAFLVVSPGDINADILNGMRPHVSMDRLGIDKALYNFVNREAIPGTDVEEGRFWSGFAHLVGALTPRNAALIERRDQLQSKIDEWDRRHPGAAFDHSRYKSHLLDLGYLVPAGAPFTIDSARVDPEIAHIAGPQLVVPVSNARYALNAANARWGSLYDALYGTDVIPEDGAPRGGKYNPQRGAKVIAFVRDFLDENFALAGGSHRDAVSYSAADGGMLVQLKSGKVTVLKDPAAFRGFQGDAGSPTV